MTRLAVAKKKMLQIRKGKGLLSTRVALSPVFATLILVAIVVICGTIAYVTAENITSTNTESFVDTAQNSQAALSERIGFENVAYDAVSNNLTVCIINCGKVDDLQIKYLFLYNITNNQQELIGYFADPILLSLGENITNNNLNILQEAYFDVSLSAFSPPIELNLGPDTIYILNLKTQRGSSFDYTFMA